MRSSRMLWTTIVAATALALAAGAVPALQGEAAAATYRTRQGTIPSPDQGLPGPEVPTNIPTARIANKFQGYYIGRVREGGLFTQVGNPIKRGTPIEHRFGRVIGRGVDGKRTSLCGFITASAVGPRAGHDRSANCPSEIRAWLRDRTHFGRDFSSKAGTPGQSGDLVTVNNPNCNLFYNYFTNDRLTEGHLSDPAGKIGTKLFYRYRTKNKEVAIVRHEQHGWGFVRMKCIDLPKNLALSNASDAGPATE